jgi:hypothetical protein
MTVLVLVTTTGTVVVEVGGTVMNTTMVSMVVLGTSRVDVGVEKRVAVVDTDVETVLVIVLVDVHVGTLMPFVSSVL